MANLPRKVKMLVHVLGLSSVAGALFLQTTVLTSIAQNGYFRGVESNRLILSSEIGLTAFAITYFGYVFIHFIQMDR